MPERPLEELQDLVGQSRVTFDDLAVEPGKVEEFARAVKDENPAHRDEEAAQEQGHPGIPAPLTFTRIAAFPRYQKEEAQEGYLGFDIGLRREYALHGEQEYEYERPLYAGETLTGVSTLTDVYEREGRRGGTMTFFVFETEFRNEDDERVLLERRTVIETPGSLDGEEST